MNFSTGTPATEIVSGIPVVDACTLPYVDHRGGNRCKHPSDGLASSEQKHRLYCSDSDHLSNKSKSLSEVTLSFCVLPRITRRAIYRSTVTSTCV